jgi:DNA-binding SARP family transcriptional activator
MEFRILGPLEVQAADRMLPVRGPKQLGLLAILLAHANEIVSSDRLIDELWGEHPPETGRKALQMQVSLLRRLLEPAREDRGSSPRVLVTRAPGYLIRVEPDELDLWRFERMRDAARQAFAAGDATAAAAGLREALALWRGAPFADLAYEPFLETEIARLEQLRLSALEERIAADLVVGRHADVVGELEALIAGHPLREGLRAQLMVALYREGRQAEALDAYQKARRALVDEVGLEPGKLLRDLEAAILRQDPSLDVPSILSETVDAPTGNVVGQAAGSPPRRLASRHTGVFVGRRAELEMLEQILAGVRAGEPAAVTIVGEPGIGKTSLLRELCTRAEAAGFEVLTGHGSELERDIPFGLVVEALDERLGTLESETLRRLGDERVAELGAVLPSLAGARAPLTSALQIERYRCHDAVRAALEQLAHRQPLLLALDDLHWADPASVELVSHLLRRPVPGSLLALSYRGRQLPSRLLAAIELMAREEALLSLELAPLSVQEATELMGDALDQSSLRALYEESGGNAFYLQQLARATSGPARRRSASGVAEPVPEAVVPEPVRVALARELDELSRTSRRLLEAAAVVGEPFDVELAAEVAGLDDAHALTAVDELVGLDVARETDVPRYLVFRHPIVRRAVYDGAKPGWRLEAHGRAANALAARGAAIGTRAHHVDRSASAGDEAAIAVLSEAGHAAAPRAPAAAARWFRAALRLLPDTADRERRLLLSLPLATALGSAGDPNDSRAVLLEALELFPAGMASVPGTIVAMIARTEQELGRADEARRLLARALAEAAPGGPEAIELELECAENHLMAGEWDLAAIAADRARSLAQKLEDRPLLLAATASAARIADARGAITEAHERVEEAAPAIDDLLDQELTPKLLEALINLACAEIGGDRLPAAADHLERGLRISRTTGQGYLVGRFVHAQAWTSLLQGRLEEAHRTANIAVETSLLADNDQSLAAAQAMRCWVASLRGDEATALAAGADAVHAAERAPRSMFAWHAHVCYGQALVEAGQPEQGREQILAAGGPDLAAVRPGQRPHWLTVLTDAELATGRIDAAETIARRANAAATFLELRSSWGGAYYARASVLLARGDARQAAAVAREAAMHYDAAGWRLRSGQARSMAGHALVLAGEPALAESELGPAHATLQACGAGRLADQAAEELRKLGARVPAQRERRAPSSTAPTG